MSHLYKLVFLAFFMAFSFCCRAQQMVQTPKDILLLCQRDNEFIGKPLKLLFKEIRPQIKLVLAQGGGHEQAPRFSFFFVSKQVYDNYRRQNKFPIRLYVVLKEPFEWTWEGRNRSKDHYLDWTKEDEEKYGNLTVMAIRIGGEYDPCDDERNVNL